MCITCVFVRYCTHAAEYTTKILPCVHPISIHTHINLHTKIPLHALIQKIPPDSHHTPLHYYIFIQLYIHLSFAKEKIFTSIIRKSHRFITLSDIISVWQPASSVKPSGWVKSGKPLVKHGATGDLHIPARCSV